MSGREGDAVPAGAARYRRNAMICLERFVLANPGWRDILPPAAHGVEAACIFLELARDAEGGQPVAAQ